MQGDEIPNFIQVRESRKSLWRNGKLLIRWVQGALMAIYKLFCFDGAGKLWVDDWIEAATDEEAVAAARAVKDALKCEVWRQNQLVATIQDGRAIYGESRPLI